ncbi:MAG: hypothetical protein LBU88_04085, partial [Treponema sp.]|nr:hypothetical protein [Treponema sp.]
MKFNENRELWLAEKLQSQKIKTTVKIIVFAFLFVCLMLLLPPFQKMLVSISVSYASLPFTVFIFLLFALSCLYAKEISAFMENSANSKLIMVLLVCALALGLCLISIFSYIYGKQWLDSDHASEMILGKILADENVLLTTSWLYSTELRLIYQTIFTMPLFKLLGGLENWALIRSINIFLNNIVLVLSFIFMMRQFKVQLKWILITSFFLFVPFYYEYWNIVTFGGYYIFFIAQVFCGLGLFTRLVNNSSKGKKVWLEFILFLALLFALGVQGIRALYIIHIPLFVTCIYLRVKSENKTNFPLFLGCCSLAAGAVGFAVNILLSVLYNFITYEVIILEDLYSTFIVKLGQSLFNLAAFFGISASSLIFSVHGIFSIIAIFATFVLFWTACKSCRKNQFLSVFFIACTLVNLFIFIVTRRPIITRYFILFMIFYIPLTALLFEHCEKFYGYIKRIAIISAIILFVF